MMIPKVESESESEEEEDEEEEDEEEAWLDDAHEDGRSYQI